MLEIKKIEFANCVDPDEAAHDELLHLDLLSLAYLVFEFFI